MFRNGIEPDNNSSIQRLLSPSHTQQNPIFDCIRILMPMSKFFDTNIDAGDLDDVFTYIPYQHWYQPPNYVTKN